jgi:putative membrane protein
MRFIARIVANSLGILLAGLIIPGFVFSGSFVNLLFAGLVLSLSNATIRPLLKFFSFPLLIITLGLFTVVINMVVLKIADYFSDALNISSVGALFWGTLLISIINGLVLAFVRPGDKE